MALPARPGTLQRPDRARGGGARGGGGGGGGGWRGGGGGGVHSAGGAAMIRLARIAAAPSAPLPAQIPAAERGPEILSATRAGAYGRGARGSAGRAPQLAGR